MTRDEAIAILSNGEAGTVYFWKDSSPEFREQVILIDRLARLGVLKLDEPRSSIDALASIVGRHASPQQTQCIVGAIVNAGLKIVEK